MNVSFKSFFVLLAPVLILGGCSSMNIDRMLPDKQVEYKREVVVDKHLEIPPDLTSSRIDTRVPGLSGADGTTYSEYSTSKRASQGGFNRVKQEVLPTFDDVAVKREGQNRWLVVNADADVVWDRIVDFWQEGGVLLSIQDPQVGLMQTDWLENRADVKNDFITDFVRGIFEGAYDAGTRDRYRVRLEEGERPGSTEVYLVHFGMEQDFAKNRTGEDDQVFWRIRPRDPGLEAIMLRRIMVFLGYSEEQAKAAVAAAREVKGVQSRLLKSDAGISLSIMEPFSKAWRLVGIAMDRVGFLVEDRNRSEGIYYVRYNDPMSGENSESWLSKLKFWGKDNKVEESTLYQVRLEPEASDTRVRIYDAEGHLLDSDTALRILTLIQEQLK